MDDKEKALVVVRRMFMTSPTSQPAGVAAQVLGLLARVVLASLSRYVSLPPHAVPGAFCCSFCAFPLPWFLPAVYRAPDWSCRLGSCVVQIGVVLVRSY